MKALVVYYSRDGHTREAARRIAEALGADIDEVIDRKNRKGILGFLRAGYDATRGKTTEIAFEKDPSEYDLVVVGSPVWNGRVTPAIRTYLLRNGEKIKKAAFFATCAGKKGKILEQMRELYGGEVIAEAVMKQNEIEEGAKEFVETLKRALHS
ncbi:flavodoxin family protein [Thermococcus gorgonarius]|uniref:Flavodoxin n=1 Tax=Thermococcus gorgonarius TaxID=71997 RepID=A0A2Z2M5C7_THEGO|nr:flavodoxin family protein [Thermococcus gorgonarius]ASJ00676.1 flavodoxin [Thermococcus gorgonarius]